MSRPCLNKTISFVVQKIIIGTSTHKRYDREQSIHPAVKSVVRTFLNTGLQNNFPRLNFHYSVSFSPAECEYESHFSHHVQIFRNFMTKV